ncbi:MAG: ROK family protein [Chitinivibrionales bacterium]|nr:ROK family protein [Chitinivibrionales bacterium]
MASKSNCWIGFDLGGTKMMATVFDGSFTQIARARKKTKAVEGVTSTINRIKKLIRDVLDEAGIDVGKCSGIGMAVPGLLNLDRGIILDAPNLGWKKIAIRSILEEEFGCPVAVVNDVDAGVYGEYRHGAAKRARCVVGVFPGTGIGGGCVYKGDILRGKSFSCLEIGHIQIVPNGPFCGCGRQGCLEAVASRLYIASEAIKAAYRGEAPHLLEIAGTDIAQVRSGAIAASIQAGDRAVERIVRQSAQWLGIGIATAVNLLAPDTIVLGGGLVEALPDIYGEVVGDTACSRVMPSFKNAFKVVVARLGDDASTTGAAAWMQKALEESEQIA